KLALFAVMLVAVVGGCTVSPDPPPGGAALPAGGNEPAQHGVGLGRACAGGPSQGRYRVAVEKGTVVTADRIDGKTAQGEEEIDVPSLQGLLDMAQTAPDDGAQGTTTLDPGDGHPTSVSIDVSDADTKIA